jgi:hypothetical protein
MPGRLAARVALLALARVGRLEMRRAYPSATDWEEADAVDGGAFKVPASAVSHDRTVVVGASRVRELLEAGEVLTLTVLNKVAKLQLQFRLRSIV